MINKKINSYKDFSFSSSESMRGGENTFSSFKDKIASDNNKYEYVNHYVKANGSANPRKPK